MSKRSLKDTIRKVPNQEFFVAALVLLILEAVLCFNLLVMPAKRQAGVSQRALEEYQGVRDKLVATSEGLAAREAELERLEGQIAAAEKALPAALHNEDLALLIGGYAKDNNVALESVAFPARELADPAEYAEEAALAAGQSALAQPGGQAGQGGQGEPGAAAAEAASAEAGGAQAAEAQGTGAQAAGAEAEAGAGAEEEAQAAASGAGAAGASWPDGIAGAFAEAAAVDAAASGASGADIPDGGQPQGAAVDEAVKAARAAEADLLDGAPLSAAASASQGASQGTAASAAQGALSGAAALAGDGAQDLSLQGVQVNFVSEFHTAAAFLRALEEGEPKPRVKSVSIARAQEGVLKGVVNLEFASLSASAEANASSLYEAPAPDASKESVFEKYEGYVEEGVDPTILLISSEDDIDPNFYMILNTSDSNDTKVSYGVFPRTETELYYNANSAVQAKLTVSGDQDQLSYEWSLGNGTRSEKRRLEIVDGKIRFDVISHPRSNDEDKVAVLLDVANDTAFPLEIRVRNDDVLEPRFNLGKTSGEVEVK